MIATRPQAARKDGRSGEGSARLPTLDLIRGVAILGILLANIPSFLGLIDYFGARPSDGSPGDAKPDPVTADEVEVALVLEDARRITAKASRQVTVPHLCGLHHVTVGVEHPRRPNAAVTCSVSLADGPHEGAPA